MLLCLIDEVPVLSEEPARPLTQSWIPWKVTNMLKDSLISDLSTVYSLYTNTRAKCSVVYLKNKRTSFHLDYKIYLGNNDMVWIRNLLLNTFLYMKFFVCLCGGQPV